MKFLCQDISISDEEFGCSISLSKNPDEYNEENADKILRMSPSEVAESIGKYILIQLTYAEDEFDPHYFYFETSDDSGLEELENFKIELYPTKFLMQQAKETYDIEIRPSKKDLAKLKIVLKKIVDGRGELIIHN